MTDKLKPCPFCNSTDIRLIQVENGVDYDTYYIICANCESRTGLKSKAQAKRRWNTRCKI